MVLYPLIKFQCIMRNKFKALYKFNKLKIKSIGLIELIQALAQRVTLLLIGIECSKVYLRIYLYRISNKNFHRIWGLPWGGPSPSVRDLTLFR